MFSHPRSLNSTQSQHVLPPKESTLVLRLPLRTSGSCRSSCGGGRGLDIVPRMTDELSGYYADLLDGSYDCVDRIVLNAYNTLCYSPGGFRHWWRQLMDGSDAELDNAHLMRMAGRFSRRARGFAKANGIPVIDCAAGERKHEIADAYLAANPEARGLFLILVSRAV